MHMFSELIEIVLTVSCLKRMELLSGDYICMHTKMCHRSITEMLSEICSILKIVKMC